MKMNRREFALGTLAMAVPMAAQEHKYSIIDAQIHVWINDSAVPFCPGNKQAARRERDASHGARIDESEWCASPK